MTPVNPSSRWVPDTPGRRHRRETHLVDPAPPSLQRCSTRCHALPEVAVMDASDQTDAPQQARAPRTADIPRPTGPGEAGRPQPDPLEDLAAFPFVEALFGRRSRRFALGDEIPDGPLAYKSRQEPHAAHASWSGCWCSAPWAAPPAGTTRSPGNARYAPHALELRRRGRRAHLPLGRRLPHRRAVLHRRLRRVLLPDPGRRRAGRPGRRGGHRRS